MKTQDSKETYRNKISKKRKSLTKQEQQARSENIIQNVLRSSEFKSANNVAFYLAVNGEATPKKLKEFKSKEFYLPVLAPNEKEGLLFALIGDKTQYKNNKFSIPEPVESHYIAPKSLDVVIMPLVGFDKNGGRLGMGGGYYDRCFSFKNKHPKKPVLIGFAYDFQEIDEIETEPWDIGLDLIATESKLIIPKTA